MEITRHGWGVFDATMPVLTREYSFGPAKATALAIGIDGGGLAIVSPPRRVQAPALDELARYGEVRALVASNAFHHLGIAEWKARFPGAAVFAPAQSIARVERKTGVHGIRPLREAAPLLGARVELIDMPHYRTGEVLLRAATPRGTVWYVTDVIVNMPVLPKHPIAKALFFLSGSGPGLRFNNIAPLFMVKDNQALRRWLAEQFRRDPPEWLIPAHGDIVQFAADPGASRQLFPG